MDSWIGEPDRSDGVLECWSDEAGSDWIGGLVELE
jgi:hypothetical protein